MVSAARVHIAVTVIGGEHDLLAPFAGISVVQICHYLPCHTFGSSLVANGQTAYAYIHLA